MDNTAEPLIVHLIELRARLLRALACVVVIFLCLFYFAGDIYRLVALPLIRALPAGSSMIATEVASPFLTPIKLTFFVSLFVAMPYILYQLWCFISPGLYATERCFALPLLLTSVVLFYLGAGFAYFVVFPLIFEFFAAVSPEGVTIMTDIHNYLGFVIKLFFAFGIAFEIPIATFLLVRSGIVSAANLARHRPYVIVVAFVAGMLLTPPDIVSQILLAVPIWFLFEVGLFISSRKIFSQDNNKDNE